MSIPNEEKKKKKKILFCNKSGKKVNVLVCGCVRARSAITARRKYIKKASTKLIDERTNERAEKTTLNVNMECARSKCNENEI